MASPPVALLLLNNVEGHGGEGAVVWLGGCKRCNLTEAVTAPVTAGLVGY